METNERTIKDIITTLDKLIIFQRETNEAREKERKAREKEREAREKERESREKERERERKERKEREKKREKKCESERAEREAREKKREKKRESERAEREAREKKREKEHEANLKRWDKYDKKSKKADLKFEKMLNKIQFGQKNMDRLQSEVGGIGRSNGAFAENSFRLFFANNFFINGVQYEISELNKNRRINSLNLEAEYDVVLTNSNKILIVEIKYKLEKQDIRDFCNKKIPKFKKLFSEYKDYTIYGAVAGLSYESGADKTAMNKGLLFFTQNGKNVIKLSKDNMELSEF